jgi:hypothetical protein
MANAHQHEARLGPTHLAVDVEGRGRVAQQPVIRLGERSVAVAVAVAGGPQHMCREERVIGDLDGDLPG